MKYNILKYIFWGKIIALFSCQVSGMKDSVYVYNIPERNKPVQVDANWDKPQWKNVKAVKIDNFMGNTPPFKPVVEAKMIYDKNNLYVIFRVQDRFVKCTHTKINDPVYNDACVEFFFSPDTTLPERYFNLEINCGGTPLMRYNIIPRKDFNTCDPEDMKQIEISHSLPTEIKNEITSTITWTVEYRLPLSILRKYSKITEPAKGVKWRANFYKTAEETSNPHYMTWSIIKNSVPDFHLPSYFGELIFK